MWAHVGDSLVVLGDGDGGGDESLNETDGWLPNCYLLLSFIYH